MGKLGLGNAVSRIAIAALAGPTPPNYAEVIQWLDGTTEEIDGNTYLVDKKGDQLRDVEKGVYTATGSITQLQFADLSGLSIKDYQGNGSATIVGNNINITGTELSSVTLSDGSYYSLEYLSGSTIKGQQTCTVVGTFTLGETLRYKSFRNLFGFNGEQAETPTYDDEQGDMPSTTTAQGFHFNGGKCWVADYSNDNVQQFTVDLSESISNMSYDNISVTRSNPIGCYRSKIGSKFFILSQGGMLYQYTMVTSDTLVGMTEDSGVTYDSSVLDAAITNFSLNEDETVIYFSGASSDKVFQCDLGTAGQIDSVTPNGSLSVGSQDGAPYNARIWDNGYTMYMSGGVTDKVYKYPLSTKDDITSAGTASVYVDSSTETSSLADLYFEGGKMLLLDTAAKEILQYSKAVLNIPREETTANKALPVAEQVDINDDVLVNYGRARNDVLKDGTLRTESASPEIYAMSQNLTTNILFTGETPTAYEEALLEYDQDYVHYMFANITDYPTIGECLKYSTAQDDRLGIYKYVDAVEPYQTTDEGDYITTDEGVYYILKEGVK